MYKLSSSRILKRDFFPQFSIYIVWKETLYYIGFTYRTNKIIVILRKVFMIYSLENFSIPLKIYSDVTILFHLRNFSEKYLDLLSPILLFHQFIACSCASLSKDTDSVFDYLGGLIFLTISYKNTDKVC